LIELPAHIADEPFDLIGSIKLPREQEFNGLAAIFEWVKER
jgi:hypothetical protein